MISRLASIVHLNSPYTRVKDRMFASAFALNCENLRPIYILNFINHISNVPTDITLRFEGIVNLFLLVPNVRTCNYVCLLTIFQLTEDANLPLKITTCVHFLSVGLEIPKKLSRTFQHTRKTLLSTHMPLSWTMNRLKGRYSTFDVGSRLKILKPYVCLSEQV